MKKLNFNWLKLYWSKIIISFCTIFIVSALSYTAYNYLTPITKAEVKDENKNESNFSNEFVDYNENASIDDNVEPFSLSENDIDERQNTEDNNLENDKINVPQNESSNNTTLNENVKTDTIKYSVEKGDTLFSISRKYMPYKSTKEAINLIKDSNEINDESSIKIGQILLIPAYDSKAAENPNVIENIDTLEYRVKHGDTLFSIAKNYMTWCDPNEGMSEIIEINKIQDASLIKEGSNLIIPCSQD